MGVYERDSFTCVSCGDIRGRKSGGINAHHLDGYNWCIEKRLDVQNGVTLCEDCHKHFHMEYGYGDNTKAQFEDWLRRRNEKIV
jgi:5-methylcytosine-specific restriction endonuclease McrA